MESGAPVHRSEPFTGPSMDETADEVVVICRELIRMDTSNPGRNERPAAEYVAELLTDVGLEPRVLEAAPGRSNVVVRVCGRSSERGALLVHGHLDVVPAVAGEWSIDPFSGEVHNGEVWGRGALDMKGSNAVTLATVRRMLRHGRRPARDLVLAFVADEEMGGVHGARYLVREHQDVFEGVTDAVGEVGGYSQTLPDGRRAYLIQTAEKGVVLLKLTATGRPGHASAPTPDNPVISVCRATAALGAHEFPQHITATTRNLLERLADLLGTHIEEVRSLGEAALGPLARTADAGMRSTATPTMLEAGYKGNVIPSRAVAYADGRVLPGAEADYFARVRQICGPEVDVEALHFAPGLETPFGTATTDAMLAALRCEDAGAIALPFCTSGSTDAKSFSSIGIQCYGFAPLQLPEGFDFMSLFHGIDERVPVAALRFGTRVLDHFLAHG